MKLGSFILKYSVDVCQSPCHKGEIIKIHPHRPVIDFSITKSGKISSIMKYHNLHVELLDSRNEYVLIKSIIRLQISVIYIKRFGVF